MEKQNTKTEKSELDQNDPRIDKAFAEKPISKVFEFIKENPQALTSSRLIGLMKRCAKKEQYDDRKKMEEFLIDRDKNFYRSEWDRKDNSHLWDKDIVRAIIDLRYLKEDYNYDNVLYLLSMCDEGNALRLGYKWFGRSSYSFELNWLNQLKPHFTPEYVAQRITEGLYLEVLTLAALRSFPLPKDLTPQQQQEFRKHLFTVLTVGWEEDHPSTIAQYREERAKKIQTLYAQYPDWFGVEEVVVIAITGHDLAKGIYAKIPVEKRKISQQQIAKLLAHDASKKAMMQVLLWYPIRLNKANKETIYQWIKGRLQSGYHINESEQEFMDSLQKKFWLKLSFDDFIETLAKKAFDGAPDFAREKDFVNKYFPEYEFSLATHCSYTYRSQVTSRKKRMLIMDLFFWKHLSWRYLHKEEKIELNKHVQLRADRHPEQAIKLAQQHPKIVTLTDKSKFDILFQLGKVHENAKISRYQAVDFGKNIGNDIMVPVADFNWRASTDYIDDLYQMLRLPQIKLDAVIASSHKPKPNATWWGKYVYRLICIEYLKRELPDKEVLEMIEKFADGEFSCPRLYFTRAWKAISNETQKEIIKKCCSKKYKVRNDNHKILLRAIEEGFLSLTDEIISAVLRIYADGNSCYHIDQLAKKYPELASAQKAHKTKFFLG